MKVIIVGGGLAGICLGHQLEENGIEFKILDKGVNHSTLVAGGMINPMTFRRLVKTWRGDEFIPFLAQYYPKIEEKIGGQFFFPIKLRRVYSSDDEKNLWLERVYDDAYSKYIGEPVANEDTPAYINNTLGNAFVNTPGYVDSKKFMEFNHQYFLSKGNLEYATFNFEELNSEEKTYQGESYTHLIFAEGFVGEDNPFFSYLPFKNAKGETLTIISDELRIDEIINRKCFVLPYTDGTFRLGSTYSWDTKDTSITEEAEETLIENYKDLAIAPIKVVNHEAGIRPTSADRRPFIGEHPKHQGIYIFNGLGAKGYTYAPYFATEFVDFLQGKCDIDDEVNITRFYERFYSAE